MEKVKNRLNTIISENKQVLESVHHGLMYEAKSNDEDLEKLVKNTKSTIQKAQQCIDIITGEDG